MTLGWGGVIVGNVPVTTLLAASVPLLLAQFSGATAGYVILKVLALIVCITVHEFGHAFVADRLGDPLPRQQDRVTLNPLRHIDPLGTVIFPALMALSVPVPLAWGKPVEWTGNPRYLTRRFSMRTIRLMVSVAGPAMNLLLALLLSVVLVVALRLHSQQLILTSLYLVQMNLGLMFFNLLPIPPLDGRSFLEFLPDALSMVRDFLMRYGSFVFLALIMLNGIGGGPSPLSVILRPFYVLIDLYIGLLAKLGGV